MKDGRLASVASTALQGVAFVLLLLIPIFSIHSDPNHLSALQFVTIDASKTRLNPAGGIALVSLPDVNDYQRHKQVFQIYLFNYCSGSYLADSRLVIDFCSKNGHEIWSMMSLARHLPAGFAVIAAACSIAVAVAAQVTYGSLVAKADDDEISITAQMGLAVYVINWVAAGCALVACVLRFVADRQVRSGGKSGRGGRGGFVRISPDEVETEYKYSKSRKGDMPCTDALMVPSPPGAVCDTSRDVSRNVSTDNLATLGSNPGDGKFEPYRSANV
ncbi:uncharacterized protein B0I36DRAFT_358587 [Microdochium trichocladiopsis]|uniref:SUR7/PalI family-domain-containing protein n=1 Tax=Microdochium trichocladiopsis TaxID=1682393 RepID=A0A9P9C0S7_9PEZI|nr:uncharacterized protein B0I36DRAFT_358587 [Microdochium trichocladiopsis]KAH7041414.1 hypothetical protein B0I36DRAFT_358587 [Microdochium trichocladiopsis]